VPKARSFGKRPEGAVKATASENSMNGDKGDVHAAPYRSDVSREFRPRDCFATRGRGFLEMESRERYSYRYSISQSYVRADERSVSIAADPRGISRRTTSEGESSCDHFCALRSLANAAFHFLHVSLSCSLKRRESRKRKQREREREVPNTFVLMSSAFRSRATTPNQRSHIARGSANARNASKCIYN